MISDEELIQRCKENDRTAQKMLFEKYAQQMLATCMRYTETEEDAKDILQDGFYKVLTKIKSFKGNSNIKTWMTRIFINEALNSKRLARNKYYHQDLDAVAELEDHTPEPQEEKNPNEVLNAVKQLPPKYRIVINLYAIDGLTHKEIAKQLGITEGSSKSRLSRARVQLDALLNKKRNV